MSEKLKRCRFCHYDDSKADKAQDHYCVCDVGATADGDEDSRTWAIICPGCGAQGPISTEEEAVINWNKLME